MAHANDDGDRVTIERFIGQLQAVAQDCPGAEVVVPEAEARVPGEHAPIIVVAFGRIEIS